MTKCNSKITKESHTNRDKCIDKCHTSWYFIVTEGDKPSKEVKNLSVAERMIKARGNMKRADVCKLVGISLSALTMYENGQRIPRDEIKVKLARLYGTTVEALFY